MKKGWQIKPFEDCIESVKYTRKIQRKDFLDDGQFPIVSQEAEFTNGYWDDEADVFKVSTPVVIFGDHTQVLKYVDFDFVLGADGVKILPPRDFLRPKFFFFQLQAAKFTSLGYARHYRLLKELEIKYPPLAEQQRIVGLLDEAFAGLATAKANAEKNLQNARALFESHLQSVFTQRGEGWVEKSLGEALVKTETTDPTRSPKTEIDYIDVSSVSKETLAIQETQRLQGKDAPSRARKLVRTNDVLFATIRPTLRRIAIVPEELDSQVCSTGYFVLRAKPDLDHRLVFYFLQSETFMTAMETLQKGASYPAVTDGDVRSQIIPIPPLKDQKEIAAKLDGLREETQRLASIYSRKLATLEALKKSLLHQAFAGEL